MFERENLLAFRSQPLRQHRHVANSVAHALKARSGGNDMEMMERLAHLAYLYNWQCAPSENHGGWLLQPIIILHHSAWQGGNITVVSSF